MPANSDRPRDGERCPCGMLMHFCAGSGKMECIDCGPTQHLDLGHDQPQPQYDCPLHGLQDGSECVRC